LRGITGAADLLRLESPGVTPLDLTGALHEMAQARQPDTLNEPREWTVQALYGRGKTIKRLPVRLMILPLPPEKAEIARTKVRRSGSKRQRKVDPHSELAAGFLMLATSLPPDIPADGICAVHRLRRQIELALKRLKSLLHIDRLPTRTEAGSLSWLYSHRIPALLTGDICQEILESPPLDRADDAGVPSAWSIQAVVIDLLRAALPPRNFTLPERWRTCDGRGRQPAGCSPRPNGNDSGKGYFRWKPYPDAYGAEPLDPIKGVAFDIHSFI
jgi:hypothetical protein